MAERFLIADPHFGHKGVTHFERRDGGPLRPWDCPDEMDEEMVRRWNSVVGPKDKVEVLGDVVINRRCLAIFDRLNGKKRLRSGNHDIFALKDYTKHFEDISAYKVMTDLNVILSHIPIHPQELRRWRANIHGHLHDGRVMTDDVIDPRYFCVSVEHIDFTPIHIDEVMNRIEEQQLEAA